MTIQSLILLTIQLSILLTVLGFALNVRLTDVTSLLRQPGLLLRSLISMNLIMPLFVGVVLASFNLHPAVLLALATISISPVPPFLPGKELKAGGASSYTFGLLATSAALSILLIPLTLAIFDRVFGTSSGVTAAAIARNVLISVLVPLAVGILIRETAPQMAARSAKPVSTIAKILLILGFIPVLFTSWPAMISLIGNGTILAMVAFVLVGLAAGHSLGGPIKNERVVLALSTAARHPGVAIAIAHTAFPGQELASAAVILYLLLNALVTIPYVKRMSSKDIRGPSLSEISRPATVP